MNPRILLLLAVFLGFGALTAKALIEVGFSGILLPLLTTIGGQQVLADLSIALILFLLWMAGDSRERRLPFWPFVILTFAAGSFGPLSYLLLREFRSAPR